MEAVLCKPNLVAITVFRRTQTVRLEDATGKVVVKTLLRRDMGPYERFLARAGWTFDNTILCQTRWTKPHVS
jgi:hypothetical protein